MKTIPPPRIFSVVFAILMLVAFAACSDDDSATDRAETVSMSGIAGVTPPAFTETPVTNIAPTVQYSGTVSWSPEVSNTFTSNTVYTATVTLTPQPGFTFTGVAEDFFTVAGATTVSNSPDSGVITAVFPATLATAPVAVTLSNIMGVTAPVHGAVPVATISSNTQYTGTVSWSPDHPTFIAGTSYTATISLTPQPGFTFTGVAEDFFTVAGATTVSSSADSAVITAIFPQLPLMPITLSNIMSVTAPVAGAVPVTTISSNTQYTGTVSWSPSASQFAADTVYTATISLTPQPGFTFTGVAEDFFTVAGATNVSNSPDSGVITAIFPATAATITLADLWGIAPPASGETPATNIIIFAWYNSEQTGSWAGQYTSGGVVWEPAVTGNFLPSTSYTAVITLNPRSGYTVWGVPAGFFKVAGASSVIHAAETNVIRATFPATGAGAPAAITETNLPLTAPVVGAEPQRSFETNQYAARVVWLDVIWGPAMTNGETFVAGRDYGAYITLTPKPGFTLSGVTNFTVSGKTRPVLDVIHGYPHHLFRSYSQL